MIAFGPVPSRRLGRSLGFNNIPPKVCTYSGVYCQVGRTHTLQVERCPFYEPEDILKSVGKQVKKAIKKGEPTDYLTFAFTVNVEEDLLSITLVHPMRESAVGEFLKKADADLCRNCAQKYEEAQKLQKHYRDEIIDGWLIGTKNIISKKCFLSELTVLKEVF
jgi:wyosine [tRNA(Phe)-imidazoG37] synthetase (radical SAM superfamily)